MPREILVELEHPGGTAAVYRDTDGAWLSGHLRHGGTLIEDSRPAAEGVRGGAFVVGGLLPAGATRALVAGEPVRTGGGAWIAIGPSLEPAVRYEDGSGRIVRPPLPREWAREPVPDATTKCPACGGERWERVTPDDDSRGSRSAAGGGWEPTPVLVCVRCGHEVGEGAWIAFDEPASAEALATLEAHHRARDVLLDDIPFPVYALADAADPPSLGGYSHGQGTLHGVTVDHGTTCVVESAREADPEAARHALLGLLHDDREPPPEASQPALALWLDEQRRRLDARVAAAERVELSLPVDGSAVRFTGLRDGDAWAATAPIGGVHVTVGARGIAPAAVRLRRLADPAGALAP